MPVINRPRPTNDWTCREVLDARAVDPEGQPTCEFCNHKIRWIHVLEHHAYPRSVETGCCCASRLCHDYDAPAAEREVKNRYNRLATFVDAKRWRPSKYNPENVWRWVVFRDGVKARCTIFLQQGEYAIYFAAKADSNDRFCHPLRFKSQSEAKAIAFELIEKANQKCELP
jgi:hypothetical protein